MTEEPKHLEFRPEQDTTSDESTRPKVTGIASSAQQVSLSSVGQLLTIVALSGYVLGLLIVNMYLFKIGVSDFSVLRPRFVLTGFLATIPLLLIANMVVAIIIAVLGFVDFLRTNGARTDKRISTVFWLNTIVIASFFMVIVAVIWGWVTVSEIAFRSDLFEAFDPRNVESLFWVLFLTPIIVTIVRINQDITENISTYHRIKLHLFGNSFGLLLAFGFVGFVYIDFFSSTYYPIIPEQFGGGRPKEVIIVLSPESNVLGATLGFGETTNGSMSQHVDFLWETEEMYVVRDRTVPDAPAVQIDRDAVSAIVFISDATLGASPVASPLPTK